MAGTSVYDALVKFIGDYSELKTGLPNAANTAAASAGTSAGGIFGSKFGAVLAGVGIEIGRQLVHGVETAVSDIANVIPDMFAKGQAFAEAIHEIQLRTGSSAEATSAFAADLTFLGIPLDNVGVQMQQLATHVKNNAKLFTDLGIAVKGSDGQWLDSLSILDNVRAVFSTLPDGPQKTALAVQMFGRSGSALIEYLNLSTPAVKQLHDEWEKLGLILTQEGIQKAVEVQHEQGLLGLAVTGLGETLFQDLAPALMTVIDAFVQLVATNGPAIKQFFADVGQYAVGLVQGLTGISMPFAAGIGESIQGTTTQLDAADVATKQIAADTAAAAYAAAANTRALDAETKSVDAQTTALQATIKSQETLYQRKMTALAASQSAELSALDAQQKALQVEQQREQLARGLRDAQEALTKAQLAAQDAVAKAQADKTLSPLDRAQAEIDAANSVRSAEEALAAVRQSSADLELQQKQDTQRAAITATAQYVSDLARLETSTDDKVSLAHTLAARQKALTSELAAAKAKGDAQDVADVTIKLQAVVTTQEQNQLALRGQGRLSDLAKQKAMIADAKAAADTTLADLKAKKDAADADLAASLAKLQADVAKADQADAGAMSDMVSRHQLAMSGGDGKGGIIGGLTGAALAGEDMGKRLTLVFSGLLTDALALVDGVGKIVPALAGIVKWIDANKGDVELALILVGASTGNLPAIAAALALSTASMNDPNSISPIEDLLGLTKKPQKAGPPAPSHPGMHYVTDSTGTGYWAKDATTTGKAAGGVIPPLTWALTGERGPEPVYGGTTGATVLPNSALGGDQPAIIRLEIGGTKLLDYIDQQLAYRRRKRT